MTTKIDMDPRAKHQAWTNGSVSIPYKGFIISIASDGADVIVMDEERCNTFFTTESYDLIEAISQCAEWIRNAQNLGKVSLKWLSKSSNQPN